MESAGGAEARTRTGRAGFTARGVLYGIVGIVALAVAVGAEKSPADQQGALAALADSTAGRILLILLAAGLGGYALFRLWEVIAGPADKSGDEARLERVASVARVLIYGGLCFSAIKILTESSSKGSTSESSSTSTVFELPAGQILVIAGGLALIGVALYQLYTGISGSLRDDLKLAQMNEHEQRTATVAGTAGHVARAVVFALTGAFLLKAGIEHDPDEAIGLDGALLEIAQQSYGAILLGAVALGLFVFGFYSLIEARYRKL
jgi:hypothetical protein